MRVAAVAIEGAEDLDGHTAPGLRVAGFPAWVDEADDGHAQDARGADGEGERQIGLAAFQLRHVVARRADPCAELRLRDRRAVRLAKLGDPLPKSGRE